MTEKERARDQIHQEALAWPGVEGYPHRFGRTDYRLGRREIGHVHGDDLIDIPLPRRLRDQVIAEGKADPHPILPTTGCVTVRLRKEPDVAQGLVLLRLSYDLAVRQKEQRRGGSVDGLVWAPRLGRRPRARP